LDFELDEEHLTVREGIRKLAQSRLAARADHYDQTGEYPWDDVKDLAENGYLGMTVPEAFGGLGADSLANAIVIEEVSRADAAVGTIVDVHNTLAVDPLVRFGSQRLKEKYLPGLASVEILGAYALTEPDAGSNAANQKTLAEKSGDEYILNGRKIFISNGGVADVYVVYAVTDKTKGSKGISAFIVEKDMAGVSFGPPEDKLGIRASHTTEVILDNVRVPAENLLGQEGEGYKIALATLDKGRVGIAAQAVGILQAALDKSVKYAKEREQFGQPLSYFQAIQFKIAEMAMDLDAARLLTYRAAWLVDRPGRWSKETSMAKLFASTAAMKHTVQAVQIHGGYGYVREYGVERLMRDAKITEIYEGTSEIQHIIISGFVLGEK